MKSRSSAKGIADYYNKTQILYKIFYSRGTGGMHYGFWYDDTKSHTESIINTTKFVAECLELKKDDRVLDAGCGIGGSSIYIAEKYGPEVVGITLSDVQLKTARKKASECGLQDQVEFLLRDFTKTGFKDGSFSKIFGIESVCHTEKKIDFLREAYRLLEKGGIAAVSDGFLIRTDLSEKEENTYRRWMHGWAVPNLSTVDGFRKDMEKAGFRKIKYYDKLSEIKKSRERIFLLGVLGYPFTWILSRIGLIERNLRDHAIACVCQKRLLSDTNNIATYGIFVAQK